MLSLMFDDKLENEGTRFHSGCGFYVNQGETMAYLPHHVLGLMCIDTIVIHYSI